MDMLFGLCMAPSTLHVPCCKCDCVKWGWGLFWPPCLKKECRFDFVTGPVRLFVAAQTFAVGLFCGMSSVAVDGIWKHLRDETKEARMARAIGHRNST